ncbi:MAG: uncharacterized protein A8A55_2312 [Amphiamblys sp. WSBS2006]|nr:MAG: uncharacterized protein A8A55_2312 [Amphiamblys sp. WSBS2006]
MTEIKNISFQLHEYSYFVLDKEKIYIVPASPYRQIKKELQNYLRERVKKLQEKRPPEAIEKNTHCSLCGKQQGEGDALLFPLCRKEHSFGCYECTASVFEKGGSPEIECTEKSCKDSLFAAEEYQNGIEECSRTNKQNESGRSFQQPDTKKHCSIFERLIQQPSKTEKIVLKPQVTSKVSVIREKTVVLLRNVAISDRLFLLLLKKTDLHVREDIGVFGHRDNENCIEEIDRAVYRPASFSLGETLSPNIDRIPPRSIVCACREIFLHKNSSLNLLLKLETQENNEVEDIELVAFGCSQMEEIMREDSKSICIGKIKRMKLTGYAIYVLPKLAICEENEMESFTMNAELPMEVFSLRGLTKTIISNSDIWERPARRLHHEHHDKSGDKTAPAQHPRFSIGRTKNMKVSCYAIHFLSFLKLHGENEMEGFAMYASSSKQIIHLTRKEDILFDVGRVKNVFLEDYAVKTLPDLRFHEENTMESIVLQVSLRSHYFGLLLKEKGSVEIGRVKKVVIKRYREKIEDVLKYVLVNEEGNTIESFGAGCDARAQSRTGWNSAE